MLTYVADTDLQTTLGNISLVTIIVGGFLLIFLAIIAMIFATRKPTLKLPLFSGMLAIVIFTTIIVAGSTVYLNAVSATGGPVHWHAAYEIWACDNELVLRSPTSLSNKLGTPALHEHNDKHIHLEGVPLTLPQDFSLGKFMAVVGGNITASNLTVPVNDDHYFAANVGQTDGDGQGMADPDAIQPFIQTDVTGKVASFTTGQKCNNSLAEVQVFAYHFDSSTNTYRQQKLSDPATYSPSHAESVPPGDCIIMEFAPHKDRTDKLCNDYGVRDVQRCGAFGVPLADRTRVCDIQEVR